jgi:hypothetical protein
MIDGSEGLPFAEMIERIKVEPALTFQQIFERKKA